MYAVIHDDNRVQLMSKTKLAHYHITSYMEPGQRFASKNKKKRFINQWLEDPNRLVCQTLFVDPTLPVGPSVKGFNVLPSSLTTGRMIKKRSGILRDGPAYLGSGARGAPNNGFHSARARDVSRAVQATLDVRG
jgi:hypothetical protein